MEKKGSLLLCAIFLMISTVYAYSIRSLSTDDAIYPKFIMYLLLGLTIMLILEVLLSKGDEFKVKLFEEFATAQFFTVLIAGISYIVLINILGYFISTSLFMITTLILLKNKKKSSIIVTLIFCIFLFLIFKLFLGVPVPTGIIF